MNSFLDNLKSRNLLKDISDELKFKIIQQQQSGIYCGFDPTAKSLHIGNLMQLLILKEASKNNFIPYVLIGKATGLIGDPAFKETERKKIDFKEIETNFISLKKQINNIFPEFKIIDNYQWVNNLSLIYFLREIGKNINISVMLAKDHIKTRINKGLSFAEFSYNLIQAYDFYFLAKNKQILVQFGGSDQWGNIVSGINIIKAKTKLNWQKKLNVAGFTIPLIVNRNNEKFGKTKDGNIWLDSNLTNVFDFYQYFLNLGDDAAQKLIFYIFDFDLVQIQNIIKNHFQNKKLKILQKELAFYFTNLIHGKIKTKEVINLNKLLFFKLRDQNYLLTKKDFQICDNHLESFIFKQSKIPIIDLLINTKIASSKRDARKLIIQNGITINNKVINNPDFNFEFSFKNDFALIKKGRKKYLIIKKISK